MKLTWPRIPPARMLNEYAEVFRREAVGEQAEHARPPITEARGTAAPTAEAAATTATGAATHRAHRGMASVRPSVTCLPLRRQPRFSAWIRQAVHGSSQQADDTQTSRFPSYT
jgi:hypothetical protein